MLVDKNGDELHCNDTVIVEAKISTLYHGYYHNNVELEVVREEKKFNLPPFVLLIVDSTMVERKEIKSDS